jgi:hypothetical protein
MMLPTERCQGSRNSPAPFSFDRGNDLVGDVLVNVEAFALLGGFSCFAGLAIAASWGQGDRDH